VNRVEYAHNKNIFKSWANGRSIYYKLPTVLHPGLTEFFYVEFALQGCKHIKANGGKTSAQDMSAEVDFMPLSAQAAGFADFVTPLNKIPAKLKRLAAALKT